MVEYVNLDGARVTAPLRSRKARRRALCLLLVVLTAFATLLSNVTWFYLKKQVYDYLLSQTPTPRTAPVHPPVQRENATLLMLCRNEDLAGVLYSVQQVEDRFNRNYHYPWIFFNDVPFHEQFKTRVTEALGKGADVTFALIPPEMWNQPDWIDEKKAKASRQKMVADDVPYGGSVSYRNMCRFNSGFFYRHELLQDYRYYWRVEPEVDYLCDINYDPFTVMREKNKTYGFTLSLYEHKSTVPTLWDAVKEFSKLYPQHVHPDNAMKFLSWTGGHTYSLCHFWTNFEIADLDFWRGEAYSAFFEFLDHKGGFYYERWGDAPVHSIGAGLLAPKDSIHFFYDIGYRHTNAHHCPSGNVWAAGRCACDPKTSFDHSSYSCTDRLLGIQGNG
ncbi:glycosyl transferase [Coprinopsis marcescibilis]|uniref:Glycosyl transferase n=1 Tax=Coprinopsis marcescibilis TaxID=230819 RepID=A0A5C3KW04_COPMA|nr:glycosyl transferase [Coprinopsis marcescibilis]